MSNLLIDWVQFLTFTTGAVCGGFAIWLLMRQSDSEERQLLLHNNRALTARLSDMSQVIEDLEDELALSEYAKEEMVRSIAVSGELSLSELEETWRDRPEGAAS